MRDARHRGKDIACIRRTYIHTQKDGYFETTETEAWFGICIYVYNFMYGRTKAENSKFYTFYNLYSYIGHVTSASSRKLIEEKSKRNEECKS